MRRAIVLLVATAAVLALVGGAALAQDPGIDDPGMPLPAIEPIVRSEATVRCVGGPCGGTTGRDVVWGSEAADEIRVRGGEDAVTARKGDDTARGGDRADVLFGGPGDDRLLGARGADDIDDGEGGDADRVRGGDGNDLVVVLDGDDEDRVDCGGGTGDTVYADPGDGYDTPSCEEVVVPIRATGVLLTPGATTYMYGDYVLTDETSGTVYALREAGVDLSPYVGGRVAVYGRVVPGTEAGQIDDGPPLLDVLRAEELATPDAATGHTLSPSFEERPF